MIIKYDNLCGYERDSKSGLGYDTYEYIYFWGKNSELDKIKQFGIDNFITYKHDDTVKFGEHQIFLSNADQHFYFVLNSNKNGEDVDKEIYTKIKDALETTFKDLDVTVKFGKGYILLPSKIEEFLDNYVIDFNNLPLDKFHVINPHYCSFPKLKEGYADKWYSLQEEILSKLVNKTLIVNGKKGKFKVIPNQGFGFFKLRARKSYYDYNLSNITDIQFC